MHPEKEHDTDRALKLLVETRGNKASNGAGQSIDDEARGIHGAVVVHIEQPSESHQHDQRHGGEHLHSWGRVDGLILNTWVGGWIDRYMDKH